MVSKLPLDLATQLIELRNLLYQINQLCWSFSYLNKQYSLESLTNEEAEKLVKQYLKFLQEIKELTGKVKLDEQK